MKLSEIYKPFPGGQTQAMEAFKAGKERIIISCGVRWGKSWLVAAMILKALIDASKNRKPIKVWIVAKNYDLTARVFNQLVEWYARLHPSQRDAARNRPLPTLRTPDGSMVQCRSAEDPEGLRGEELDLLIIDEAAILPRKVWETLQARLVSRMGKAVCISTPFGQNWFWEEYQKAKEKGAGFNFPTWDNPKYAQEPYKSNLDNLKATLPKQVWLQDYEASFLPDAASVFPTIEGVVKTYHYPQDPEQGVPYVMGVDLAQAEDFTCIAVFNTYTNRLVYFERLQKIPYPDQKTRIMAAAKRYKYARIIIDSTGVGMPIADDFRREGMFIITDFKFSGRSKKDLLDKGIILIEQKDCELPSDQISGYPIIDEFKAFGYRYTDAGNVIYGAPQGLHDDCVISCLLGMYGLKSRITRKDFLGDLIDKNRPHNKGTFQYD